MEIQNVVESEARHFDGRVGMKQTITAQEQELNKIFSDDYLFEIPEYQRPYAWTTEQAAELLEDLIASMGDGTPVENVSPYFLGSIVLIKDPSYPHTQVVDGQQRLTTLTILVLCSEGVGRRRRVAPGPGHIRASQGQ